MMRFSAVILACLSFWAVSAAEGESRLERGDMSASVDSGRAEITHGTDSAEVSLTTGRITFHTAAGIREWRFGANEFMSWSADFPGPEAAEKAETVATDDGFELRLSFPVQYHRTLKLNLAVSERYPGIAVEAALHNTSGELRYEHCFLGWQETAADYVTRDGDEAVLRGKASPNAAYLPAVEGDVDVFGWLLYPGDNDVDWLLVTQANFSLCATHADYIDWDAMLHPSPREQLLAPGDAMRIAFVIGSARDEKEAEARYRQILALKMPAAAGITPPLPLDAIDYGELAAPSWMAGRDRYGKFPWPWELAAATTVEERLARWSPGCAFLNHAATSDDLLRRVRGAGMPCIVYYNWMEIYSADRDLGTVPYEPSRHPEWGRIDRDGNRVKSFYGQAHDLELYSMCMHRQSLHRQAVKQMRILGDRNNSDGIFIDCAVALPECYGDIRGVHRHVPGRGNRDMYMELLNEVYLAVKSFGDEKLVMLNNSNSPEQWRFCDCAMAEETVIGVDWDSLLYKGRLAEDAYRHGKYPSVLSYLSLGYDPATRSYATSAAPEVIGANAVFSFVYARLFDMLWSDWGIWDYDESLRELRDRFVRIDLTRPLGARKTAGALYYREFADAVIVLNSDRRHAASGTLEVGGGVLHDALDSTEFDASTGRVAIELPPYGARILIKETTR